MSNEIARIVSPEMLAQAGATVVITQNDVIEAYVRDEYAKVMENFRTYSGLGNKVRTKLRELYVQLAQEFKNKLILDGVITGQETNLEVLFIPGVFKQDGSSKTFDKINSNSELIENFHTSLNEGEIDLLKEVLYEFSWAFDRSNNKEASLVKVDKSEQVKTLKVKTVYLDDERRIPRVGTTEEHLSFPIVNGDKIAGEFLVQYVNTGKTTRTHMGFEISTLSAEVIQFTSKAELDAQPFVELKKEIEKAGREAIKLYNWLNIPQIDGTEKPINVDAVVRSVKAEVNRHLLEQRNPDAAKQLQGAVQEAMKAKKKK